MSPVDQDHGNLGEYLPVTHGPQPCGSVAVALANVIGPIHMNRGQGGKLARRPSLAAGISLGGVIANVITDYQVLDLNICEVRLCRLGEEKRRVAVLSR